MISDQLLMRVCCPACRKRLRGDGQHASLMRCEGCGLEYPQATRDFLDLRPRERFQEQTKYLDESLHADARHERVSPPLLGSKIRNDMLRRFLRPAPHDRVVDLGCGSGRTLLWNRDWGASVVGVDIASFFSEDARRDVDLLLGDLRRLPFPDGAFNRAYSLDVLEHLSPDALRGMLAEANRILEPGGTLFVYTHVRRNAPLAAGLRWINAAARTLERAGLIDMRQERLRKSDHLNPLRDIPELEGVVRDAGFRIARITYYTPLVGGFVENILIRMVERVMARRAAGRLAVTPGGVQPPSPKATASLADQPPPRLRRSAGASAKAAAESGGGGSAPPKKGAERGVAETDSAAIREARKAAKERIGRKGPTYAALRALSAAMKLDLLLFGRIRSGPFFALLEKTGDARSPGLTVS